MAISAGYPLAMADSRAMLAPGYDPYRDVAGDVGWFGSDIVSGIGKAAKAVANTAVKVAGPVVQKALPIVQTALRNSGPWGSVANAAISGMQAGLSGKNIGEIAMAAARGAAPSGIDAALSAATALAKGEPVLNTALTAGAHAFAPGSAERFAYSVAADALRKGALKPDLGNARRALATEGQRRAFDAAVGSVAVAATKGVPTGRPMTALRPIIGGPRPTITVKRPPVNLFSHRINPNQLVRWRPISRGAASFIARFSPFASNVALLGDTGALPGGALATSMPLIKLIGDKQPAVRVLQQALKEKFKSSQAITGVYDTVTFNNVKAYQAARNLGRPDGAVGQMTWAKLESDPSLTLTAVPGITPNPAVIPAIVASTSSGLAGGAIAANMPIIQKIGDRQPAVKILQLTLRDKFAPTLAITGVYDTVTFNTVKKFQGSRGLKVDGAVGLATWKALEGPAATPKPPIVIQPVPVVGDDASNPAATIQSKAILAAWGKTDGLAEAGVQDYGQRAEDTSTTIGPRDKLMIASFARFNNRVFKTALSTDGNLTAAIADALRIWAEKKAQSVISAGPSAPVTPQAPAPAPTQVIPTPLGPVAVPTLPALPPIGGSSASSDTPAAVPGGLTLPAGGPPPFVPTGVFSGTATTPSGTATTTVQSAPAEVKKSDSDMLALAAGGAVMGFLIGSVPGALVGAAAGAFAASAK